MPRVRRKPKVKRGTEAPMSEWTEAELQTELDRLGEDSSGLNPWAAFKRESDLRNELFKRTGRDE